MDISDRLKGDIAVVSLKGSLDALTAPSVTDHFNRLIKDGKIQIIAVFTDVDYTSSAGLRVLLGAVKETRSHGGDFFLVDIQPAIEKVLSLSGFTSIIKIFADLDTAVQSFS
jgi:anti-sigma B factor antagonist